MRIDLFRPLYTALVWCKNRNYSTNTLENDFRDSYFRVCQKCSKTRILDIRAVNKFPLGSYYYAEQMRKIVFECSRLVGTDCSVPEDVVADEREMNDPVQLLILKTKKNRISF